MMLKTWNLLALVLSTLIVAPTVTAQEPSRPPIANQVEAYSGAQGVKVWTLRVGERSANQALVQVTGVDHDWDKRIYKMDVEKTFKDVRYSTKVNGKQFIALIVSEGYGEKYAELYLPGESQSIKVTSNAGLAEQGNPEHFLTDYLEQKK